MPRPAFALAIFFLLALSFAASEAPQLATSLSATVWVQGTVTAIGGEMRSIQMNVSVPSSAPYQIVEAGELMKFDGNGNAHLSIHSASPTNPFTYSKKITVQSVARTTPSLPGIYAVPSDYGRFLSPTPRTQSGDEGMRNLAENITAGAQTPFEKVALLAIYVNRNMEYVEGMVGQEKDALWVKENMHGVCTEYSTLFAALARSIGIPVRYISGYVYSDKFSSWMGHAWAEAYVGEWVPVDPTWFEVGALDAMHIEESRNAEFGHRDALSASVTRNGVEIVWDTGAKSGAIAGNIETGKAEYAEKMGGFALESAAGALAPGGTTIAYIAMNGTDYRAIPLSLVGCVGSKSIILDESERYLVLEPGKVSIMVWQLNASSELPKGYIYSCPITLNSPYLEPRTIVVGVDPALQIPPRFEASLRESNTPIGQENSVFLEIPKELRGKEFAAVLPDGIYASRQEGASGEISFLTKRAGSVPVIVASESGGVQLLRLSSGSQARASIDSFEIPDNIVEGKPSWAHAEISAQSYPADITLDFSSEGRGERLAVRLTAPANFTFNFTPSQSGPLTLRLVASSQDSSSEKNRVAEAAPRPSLAVGNVETIYSNGTLYARISFLQAGSPRQPTFSVAGSAYSASEYLVLVLPVGKHPIQLSWSDAAGNQYASEGQISVSQPGILSTASSAQGCPLAIGAILLAMAFAASRR